MKVAKINVDKNIEVLNNLVLNNKTLSSQEVTSIEESTEVIKILLERMSRKKKSEKSDKDKNDDKDNEGEEGKKGKKKKKKKRKKRDQLPSERYPNIPIVEKELEVKDAKCSCCNKEMRKTGMTEVSEHLTVIPKKYLIYRFLKHKYSCNGCRSNIMTASMPPRIVPGSSYSDEMILDVALSKYCDLLPIERYAAMAARNGLVGLPPASLIGLTHHLAKFLMPMYEKLRKEVAGARIIHADETPHKMLEGSEKKYWYLWGFSSLTSSFFEIRDTRAGEVAGNFLKNASAEVLVSDVFSGYRKAVSDTNEYRSSNNLPALVSAWCNAHARRKFKEAEKNFASEVKPFLECYRQIYKLEKGVSLPLPIDNRPEFRSQMRPYFLEMKRTCKKLEGKHSPHSALAKAVNYFLKNYEGLTLCLEDIEIPLDNNAQERKLRPPVVGRKTWYGTHSEKGAKTAAVLFSIVSACQANKVNPREYFPYVVEEIHQNRPPPTPYEYLSAADKT